MKKGNCYLCAHLRTEKDYVQQSNCKLEKKPKDCNSFIDRVEYMEYLKMMKEKEMVTNNLKPVDYIIISKPSYIKFECPYCEEEVEVPFNDVNFKTDCWDDGAFADCPECGEEVELDKYEYD